MPSAEKIAVTFVKNYGLYNAGEQAGFSPNQAKNLVVAGIATYLSKDKEVQEPEVPQELAEASVGAKQEEDVSEQGEASESPTEAPKPSLKSSFRAKIKSRKGA